MNLSTHFTLSEMIASQTAIRKGIDNTPNDEIIGNLIILANTMEQVRSVLGDRPIRISSGYRSPKLNSAIGGSQSSAHMRGLACDFTCPTFGTVLETAKEISESIVEFDQLIAEGGTWIHLGLSEGAYRRELLTARFPNGRAVYERGLNA